MAESTIFVSRKEVACLLRNFSGSGSLLESIHAGNNEIGEEDILAMRENLIEKYDFLGLDSDYEATVDGRILEDLIDKLNVV